MKTRVLTFAYSSHISDEEWRSMSRELVSEAEQAACDYAASCLIDEYELIVAEGGSP
jgi:hypothetical protein